MNLVQTINSKPSDSINNICSNIKDLIELNCSHVRINLKNFTSMDIHRVNTILACIKETDQYQSLNIMLDIPFSKMKYRIATNSAQDFKKGENLYVFAEGTPVQQLEIKQKNFIDLSFFDFLKHINLDEVFFWGDGEAELKLKKKQPHYCVFEVTNDFTLLNNKSLANALKQIYLDETQLSFLKDITDKYNITDLFVSFCENSKDILELRKIFPTISINAKIETKTGVDNLDEILEVADGIMIARGDLALNTSIDEFLTTQNIIANKTNVKNKKLFFATDILTSLITKDFPSRADVCDIEIIRSYFPEAIILKTSFFHNKRFFKIQKFIEDIC